MSDIYGKLTRVRKPRVHITYDVEVGDAKIERELPFVMGVMGDFAGDNAAAQKPLKDRKFTQIDRDNFNDVMKQIAPTLSYRVENTLAGDGSEMAVNLKFNSLDDFEPTKVVQQVEPLKALLETREKLRDLLSKADNSTQLEELLEDILKDNNKLAALSSELGINKPEA
ncbi:type VI secretion system contractile sheath small subunit [Rhodovarius crocodyli]|uniref:Type VI secretion system contractile sheath small subunit n=1 Tax=Rhodovarius crocodyli TaxID=1979269 RepID=A0A437MME2_9PROT|nr:type VI secretion system contractile sheath small subunit [Rhodovarius crocodyli]RVT98828.1 type VI secretion system contractile sheath small subunit [Rhodovarius crocodyli]